MCICDKFVINLPIPILIFQGFILHQLLLDHHLLDVVYRMDVVHGVLDHPPQLFQLSEVPDHRHRRTLNHYVAACQDFKRF